jgi:sulfofructose kinase
LAEKSTGGRSFIGFPSPYPTHDITVDDLNKETLLKYNWLLISDLNEPSALAAKWFREAGKPVVIDGDYLRSDIINKLPLVDHLLISSYTYTHLLDSNDDYEKNLRKLRDWQKNEHAVTAVTLGAEGVAGIDENGNYFRLPAYKVDVVDTTGAGDVFHGAYIAGRLKGLDAENACQFAQAVSAVKCTKLGGRAAIPTMEQVKIFMDTGKYDFPEFEERAAYYCMPPFDRFID